MARLGANKTKTGQRILVVDDSEELRVSTVRLLSREGHTVLAAEDGTAAIAAVRQFKPHCILLDYFMPDMTGEEVVVAVRQFDTLVQIVLVTGYAEDRPAREMMQRLDIQGYHDKAEGPEKLLVWVGAALKAHEQLNTIQRNARGLQTVLDAAGDVHRLQPIPDLLEASLHVMLRVIDRSDGLVAATNSGLLVTNEVDDSVVLRASAGRFASTEHFAELPKEVRQIVRDVIVRHELVTDLEHNLVGIPMGFGDRCLGAIALEHNAELVDLAHQLRLFANQVALALENIRLYELATVDSLTRCYTRAHTLQRLLEAIKLALREGSPMSLIMIDLDHFKGINDRFGHVAGDMTLARVGECLREAIRDTDVVGRYGGEEFLVIAPATDPKGAAQLAERIRAAIENSRPTLKGQSITLTASVAFGGFLPEGVPKAWSGQDVTYDAWDALIRRLIDEVDVALYGAKDAGRNLVVPAAQDGRLGQLFGGPMREVVRY